VTEKARDLVNAAMEAGWSVAYKPGVDTGFSPFVTVEAMREGGYFSVTWHTRATGTYRLFNCSFGETRYKAHDVSLKRILEEVATL
jgi:hypothetical protein